MFTQMKENVVYLKCSTVFKKKVKNGKSAELI